MNKEERAEIKKSLIDDKYKVNLEVFEGPLDLLLHLIKKNDLEIADIPISLITEEYLRYLDAMQELNVNVAGDFLLMAAELMHIKSKMLLPVEDQAEEVYEEDPRADLQRRLLEYQRYKEAANTLKDSSILFRDEFVQQDPEKLPARRDVLAQENVFKLVEAFQILLTKIPEDRIHEVTIDRISVNERIFQLIEMIKKDETLPITALVGGNTTKYELVITFLALLEMAKLSMIKVVQAGQLQTMYVTGVMEPADKEEVLQIVKEDDDIME